VATGEGAPPEEVRPPDEAPPPAGVEPAQTRRRARIHTGELISAASALVLLPIMFALEWFGTVGLPRSRRSGLETAENAWRGMTYTRWLMLLAIVVALGSVALHASQRGHGTRTDTSCVMALVGTLTAVVLAYRVLINLPDPRSIVDIKIGAYLGLLAALGIALGGWDSVRERRARPAHVRHRSRRPNRMASRPQAR
jgi:hypothetical protein